MCDLRSWENLDVLREKTEHKNQENKQRSEQIQNNVLE